MTVLSPERQPTPTEFDSASAHHRDRTSKFDLYEVLLHPKLLRVWPCVLGIVLGFLACCFAGASAAKTNFYQDFHRFTDYLSPTTLFYPSISQMMAMVNAQSTPDQTIVIIGGNSIFNGVGQRSSEIWSDQLRKDLGSQFAVFNFSACGSQPFEGGYWVAESLLKKGRKVLYATVAIPTMGGAPEGGKVYGYLYWDALSRRGLLESPDRTEMIARRLSIVDDREKNRIAELKLRMQLDKILHFQDLWTEIGYKNLFTVWTDTTRLSPFKARKDYPDLQPDPKAVSLRFSDSSPTVAKELATVRGYCDGYFDIQSNSWKPREAAWSNLSTDIKSIVPDSFKRNCVVVIASNPPYFLKRITAGQRARIEAATKRSEQCWKSAGYHAVTTSKQFTDEDFQDCWHLVGAGGTKMSSIVAHQILALNQELGYCRNGASEK